jgi:7-carboxy-7-deazaguanine synthase
MCLSGAEPRATRIPKEVDLRLSEPRGYLFEIFSSIQGEGIHVGERQLFVRTAGCSATCRWCDTVPGKKRRPYFVVHGARRKTIENPVTAARAMKETLSLANARNPVRSVSITGGEPLEQPGFVAALSRRMKDKGFRTHLETSGIEAAALPGVVEWIDVIAMDIKLPSATGKDHWDAHREFLRIATARVSAAKAEVFVKVVVDHTTPVVEIERAVDLVSEAGRRIPLVLQPESGAYLLERHGPAARKRLAALLDLAQRAALGKIDDVRVIPQCHKLLKVR